MKRALLSESRGGVVGAVALAVAAGIILLFVEYGIFLPASSADRTTAPQYTGAPQAASEGPGDRFSPNLSGTWTGEVQGDRRVYPMSVEIVDDGTTVTATATYPDIPCIGTWTELSRTSSELSFIEDMPTGVVCFDDVPVRLTVQNDSLRFEAESGDYFLSAELEKSSG